ncbi:hypothetical protein [Candidatus Clostridium stratigraminis]|uniref:FtsX-like permease family protein n=1 Tax=Candidatus Clostridium stratigraminis TaxID=3381661 RepID=A0ABW8T4P7_9CLOT
MNNLWYSFREFKNSIIFKLIILVQIILSIILLYRVNEIRNYEYGKLDLIQKITKDKTIYTFISNYNSAQDLLKDSLDSSKFGEFYSAIVENYSLVTVTPGEVFMDVFQNNSQFIDNDYIQIDKYKLINSLQCSSNFFSVFDIKLSQGNLSEFTDYTKLNDDDTKEKLEPVILGDSYKSFFKLNDIIKTKYKTLKVVGFLRQNQFYLDKGIYDPSRAKNLNTYIICPIPYQIQIANLNNALLVCDNSKNISFSYIQNDIKELSKKSDIKLSINNPSDAITNFVNTITYNANIKILIVYIIMFFVVIGLLAIFINRINARRKEFSVHLMHGATYMDIYIRILLENLYLLIMSTVLAFYYLQRAQVRVLFEIIKFDFGAFEKSVIIIFIIMIIVAMVPIHNIRKNRLNYLIKGE